MLETAWLENYFLPDVIIAVIRNDKDISFKTERQKCDLILNYTSSELLANISAGSHVWVGPELR